MTIASIRQRVAAATPGPWAASYGHVWWTPADAPEFPLASLETDDDHYGFRSTPERKSSDATFIAHARTDVELLLAVAEAAARTVGRLYRENGGYGPTRDDLLAARADLEEALAALEAGA